MSDIPALSDERLAFLCKGGGAFTTYKVDEIESIARELQKRRADERSAGSSAPLSAGSMAPNPSLAPVSEEVVEEVARAIKDSAVIVLDYSDVTYLEDPVAVARAAIEAYQAALKGGDGMKDNMRLTVPVPTSAPVRVQRKRSAGWKMPPNTVYVGRPSFFGNHISTCTRPHNCALRPCSCCDAATDGRNWCCVLAYREYVTSGVESRPSRSGLFRYALDASAGYPSRDELVRRLPELRGKNLACWCPLDVPCHADVLLELANSVTPKPPKDMELPSSLKSPPGRDEG